MESDLTSMPSWLEIVPNESKTTEGEDFGFDESGMWFTGDSGEGTPAYPVRTNFNIGTNDTCEIIFSFHHNETCADQGICIFNTENTPEWEWDVNASRIAYQINCGCPEINGQTNYVGDNEECEGQLTLDQIYTAKVTYNPQLGSFTAELYEGTSASGTPILTQTVNESLPAGNYRIGFDADQDDGNTHSYFTYLKITTSPYTNCPRTTCTEDSLTGFICYNKGCKCSQMVLMNNAYVPAITVCHLNLNN